MERHLKIAIVGTCETSRELAPYKDDTWRKWLVGEHNHTMPCADAWFELHAPHELEGDAQKWWIEWLAAQEFRVYMQEKHPAIPMSERFPIEALRQEFPPPWFFTSTVSYMLAFAVMNPEVAEIGIWGIDMAHDEEYGYQKPGCLIYIMEALRRGIRVWVPAESDLMQPLPLYGYANATPQARKFKARRDELEDQRRTFTKALAELELARQKIERDLARIDGGMQNQKWIERTYG